MSQLDINTQQIAIILQWINNVEQNAKTTDEFPLQSPLNTDSLIRVEDSSGVSKHIAILDILNKASFQLTNKLLYFNGITIVGNTVTLLAGSVWRVDNVVYSNVSNIPFTVPYVSTPGDFRKDLIVGGGSNTDVTKIVGSDSDVPIEPNYPLDKVIICSLIVSDSDISLDSANGISFPKGIEYTATGGETSFVIATTVQATMMYYNGVPQSGLMWDQSGNIINLNFDNPLNNGDFMQLS